MGRMSSYAVLGLLEHLDDALRHTTLADGAGPEGRATWHIRMARERLLLVAVGDVAVEPMLQAA